MIKKLRNKMLMMNMISTFCLILIAFSAIYMIIYNNVESKIRQSLYRASSLNRPMMYMQHQPEFSIDDGKPFPKGPQPENENIAEEHELRDLRNFSVFVDGEGNAHTDSIFGENSEHYKEIANTALSQKSTEGEFTGEEIVWRFATLELPDGAKIIALADITAEKSLLRQLIISFSVGAMVLFLLIFFISLYFANKAIKPIEEAWNKQKQFVADASHELRTPLAAINTNIDVLLSKSDDKAETEVKWLRYIKTEVQRLSELSGNLLLMAKLDSNTEAEKTHVSVSEIAEAAALNLEAVAFEKQIKLDYRIEQGIEGNVIPSQITRLCLILLDNAIKYSYKDETVKISLEKDTRGNVVLKVQDKGEIIPKEDTEKIFDRFYRGDKSRSTSGYGLGLAMAKEIVNIHNGKISVKSSYENGTEFTVILPL